MSRRRTRLVLLVAAGLMLALLVCAPLAQAKGVLGSGVGPSIGPDLNPLPSIGELVKGVVNGLFGALLSALTPDFLKHADIHALEWLVELPNVADASVWPTVSRLETYMMWVAGAILPTTLIIATAHDTALSLSFRANPSAALFRFIGAVFWLVLYRFSFRYGVAFVDALTHTMLSWPVVAQGLDRTVLVMFGGSVLVGAGGAFLAVLGLVALVFAITLFALKVLILMVLAILFVSGPLFIALTPLPVVDYLARGWLLALVGVCLIPVGWCIVFATAGAISLDVTNLGGGAHIGSRIVGAFAALATFYIAFKWPLMVLGHVRSSLGGLGVRPGAATGGGGGQSDGALAGKAQRSKAKLQAAMLAGGRGIGLAAGQLGAPRGGLVGLAGRQARAPLAVASATGAIAAGPPRTRPRPTATGERIASAGDRLRETPGQMREAWRSAGETPPPPGSGRRPAPGARNTSGAQGKTRGQARRGQGVAPAATPARARRPGAKGSGTSSSKVPSAGASSPAPAKRASSARPQTTGSSAAPGAATRNGSHTSTSKRPPAAPPARPVQTGGPASPKASGRRAQAPGSSTARRQVSAPAQPGGGGTSRQTQTRPSTTQRPRPGSSRSHTAQPPAQARSQPNARASRSTRPPAQPRQPNSPASRSTSTPTQRPPRRPPAPSRTHRKGPQR
jgi:hypothetical protein